MKINKRNIFIKSLIVLVVLFMSFVSPFAVIAEDDPANPGEDVVLDDGVNALVTFTNAPSHQPDLFVTKKVTTESADTEIPDTSFSFQIRIDGAAYAGKKFTVINSSGEPVLDDHGNPLTGVTTSSGGFSLKHNQTAWFEYVGANKTYEIKEIDTDSKYTCLTPASGVDTGTIGKDGSSSNFTNLYTPPFVPPVIPTPDNGAVSVIKQISWPSGYTYEDTTTPEFTFKLEVDDEKVANYEYLLVDLASGTSSLKKTDAEGRFKLHDNEKANFTQLKSDADYKVSELISDNWRLIGENDREGSTGNKDTLVFSNVTSSFIVNKTLSKGTTEESFSFTLYNASKNPMSGVTYWLYSTDGSRLKDDSGSYVVETTTSGGKFTLKQNQAAVFMGLPAGTVYSVVEDVKEGFRQVTPLSAEGYTNKVVTEAGSELLPFVNEIKDEQGSLSVTKKLELLNPLEAPLVSKSFTFVLEMKDKTTGVYSPLAGAVYTIGSDTTNYETDANGQFTLKQNETAYFEKLILNREYRVKEITGLLPEGYTLKGSDTYQEGLLADGGNLSFNITNIYTPKKTSLRITKVKSSDDTSALPGAVFELYTDSECNASYKTTSAGDNVQYTTGSDGTVIIEDLKEGTYYLKEITAPGGYKVLPSVVKLVITRALSGTSEGFKMTATYDDSVMGKVSCDASESYISSPLLGLTVKDDDARIVKLPNTGGPGIYLYLIVGSALLTYGLLEKRR